jgi:hypothetical protein
MFKRAVVTYSEVKPVICLGGSVETREGHRSGYLAFLSGLEQGTFRIKSQTCLAWRHGQLP